MFALIALIVGFILIVTFFEGRAVVHRRKRAAAMLRHPSNFRKA